MCYVEGRRGGILFTTVNNGFDCDLVKYIIASYVQCYAPFLFNSHFGSEELNRLVYAHPLGPDSHALDVQLLAVKEGNTPGSSSYASARFISFKI
jgi:hypothetical protein